jgi:hypothetical protein
MLCCHLNHFFSTLDECDARVAILRTSSGLAIVSRWVLSRANYRPLNQSRLDPAWWHLNAALLFSSQKERRFVQLLLPRPPWAYKGLRDDLSHTAVATRRKNWKGMQQLLTDRVWHTKPTSSPSVLQPVKHAYRRMLTSTTRP